MKQINEMICEASEKLSRDFEVGKNVLSKQTKDWLKELDNAVEKHGFSYEQCRDAAKKFKLGDFEGALKTIWGKKLDIEIENSENGGNIKNIIYTVHGYGIWKEHIEYKGESYVHIITGTYVNCPNPGYSLGTVISVHGKSIPSIIEVTDDKMTREALSSRNTANIYNILFVGCDIHSKFLSKPMLKLKKSL